MAECGFGRIVDDRTLQYERIFAHPIERLWRAITDPAEFGQWFMAGSLELRLGGAYRFGAGDWTGEVLAATPPTLLRLGGRTARGGQFMMEYVLEPVAGGVRMLFTTRHGDPVRDLDQHPNGVAGGWHELFDSLGEWVDGVPIGTRLPRTDLAAIAEGWANAKVEEGAFDAASAARHALDLRREEEVAQLNRDYRRRRDAGLGGQGDGGLARFPDRWTVEYLRTYPHPIERVWRAITDPNEFRAWFIRGDIELKEGGAYRFESGDWTGVVQAVDPPRYIRFSGDKTGEAEAWFEYELTPLAGGTRMRFAQRFDPNGVYTVSPDLGGDIPVSGTPWKPGFVGGWHEFWDALGDYLDGVLTGSRLPTTELSELVEGFMDDRVREGRMTEDNGRRLKLGLRRRERWNELNKIYREHIPATLPPG